MIKKPEGYVIAFRTPVLRQLDIRDSASATWKDVVASVMNRLGDRATLDQIYSEVEGHEKTKANPNWQAKVRQTLQNGDFRHVQRGVWAAAA